MRRDRFRPPAASGFSLIEVLIVLAIFALVVVATVGAFLEWAPRIEVRRRLEDVEMLLAKARITAIRLQTDVVVERSLADGSLEAFTDRDGDRQMNAPSERVGRVDLGNAGFGGPSLVRDGPDATTGLTAAAGGPVLVYRPLGAPLHPGTFRLLDGPNRNCFEIAVQRLTGLTELRKYLEAADGPLGVAGFFAEAGLPGDPLWTWY